MANEPKIEPYQKQILDALCDPDVEEMKLAHQSYFRERLLLTFREYGTETIDPTMET